MADEHKTDIVMRFVMKGQIDVDAECALGKNDDDDFMDGFEPATYQNYSNFFQLKKFDFEFEVKDEAASKSGAGGGTKPVSATRVQGSLPAVKGDFASWRSATDEQAKDIKFQLEFDRFSFDRLIDSASPIFFQHCVDSTSFASATMVKRVSLGGDTTTDDAPTAGFLRIDFTDVLITSLNWDDGDMTTEKCEFICREFKLKFRRQKPDGSLDDAVAEVKWKASDDQVPGDAPD